MREQNARHGPTLAEVPPHEWPGGPIPNLMRVLRSATHLVQIFAAPMPAEFRLSVCRSELGPTSWAEGISWDDLQGLKAQAGYADRLAVEIYPAAADLVNVANMRHLWILQAGHDLPFVWKDRRRNI
jgi:hypothetical protein